MLDFLRKFKNPNRVDNPNASQLVKQGEFGDLYKTKDGFLYWLNDVSCIDADIKQSGEWEPLTVAIMKQLVNEGDVVLDIGANVGSHTVLLSKLVGDSGKVWAFEPTNSYSRVLAANIEVNNLSNTELFQVGLSDKPEELKIYMGQHSATIHETVHKSTLPTETITLTTLDEFMQDHPLDKIDFIKIDVDGHEPMVLKGGQKTLNKFKPLIFLEVSHEHYLEAGVTAWDFYQWLKTEGYYIYSEDGLVELKTQREFLIKCGNFTHSANILISQREIS